MLLVITHLELFLFYIFSIFFYRFVDSSSSIDLLNVAFAKIHPKNTEVSANDLFNTPDRITGRAGFQALKSLSPSRKWNFVEVSFTLLSIALSMRSMHYF